jgi:hypothetical protein
LAVLPYCPFVQGLSTVIADTSTLSRCSDAPSSRLTTTEALAARPERHCGAGLLHPLHKSIGGEIDRLLREPRDIQLSDLRAHRETQAPVAFVDEIASLGPYTKPIRKNPSHS